MLDQVIAFSDDVNARTVTIVVDKVSERILITADKAPGITFAVAALKMSKGGVINDLTASAELNRQLAGKPHIAGARGEGSAS
jgi:hypothetical protein